MLNPVHPGVIIRDEILPPFGVTIARAAEVLNHPRPNLNRLLNGQQALTPVVALKIEAAFGGNADLLMRVQAAWDMAEARKRAAEITAGIARQPLAA